MKITKTIIGNKALETIYKGVNLIYKSVSMTLGPAGKNMLMYGTWGKEPRITNDGFTVGQSQIPKDPFIRVVVESFMEGCKKTNERVGDGTTATTTIAGKLFNNIYNLLISSQHKTIGGGKVNRIELKKKLRESAELIKSEVLKVSKKIKTLADLERVAIVSTENEELGKTIADMAWKVGVDGYIDITDSFKGVIETEVVSGARFPAKVAAKGFVNKPAKFEMVGEHIEIVLTNQNVDSVNQINTVLEPLIKDHPKIYVFAPKFSNEVIELLFNTSYPLVQNATGKMNRIKGSVEICPVLIPALTPMQLDDLSVVTGATFFDKDKGMSLSTLTDKDLGFADKLIVKDSEAKEDATLIGGAGTKLNWKQDEVGFNDEKLKKKTKTPVQERLEILKEQLTESHQTQNMKELLKRRIASVSSGQGIIRVGATSRAEEYYLKLKAEDGKCAAQSALRGGYVKGGGLCLKELSDKLKDNDPLKTALMSPYDKIQADFDNKLEITDDIIDPTEAVYYAVENAVNVVSNLITTGGIEVELDEPRYGDGEFAMAKALTELVVNDKINKGIIKANETEIKKDELMANFGVEDEEYINY